LRKFSVWGTNKTIGPRPGVGAVGLPGIAMNIREKSLTVANGHELSREFYLGR